MARLQADPVLGLLPIETNQTYEGTGFPYILITVPDAARPYYAVGARPATHNGIYVVRGVQHGRGLTIQIKDIAARIIVQLGRKRDTDIVSSILESEYFQTYTDKSEQTYTDYGGIFEIVAEG